MPRIDDAISTHAQKRQQQRSIPSAVIDCLLDFGDVRPAGTGAESYYFTKRSWRKVSAYFGPGAKAFETYRNAYAIVSGGNVVTAAYRY